MENKRRSSIVEVNPDEDNLERNKKQVPPKRKKSSKKFIRPSK